MNLRISKSWQWSSGMVLEGDFAINHYDATVDMTTQTDDEVEHSIALDRQHWWFINVMQDAVLMHDASPLLVPYQQTGQRIVALPYLPVDHVILIMLYCKLNAIMDHRITVNNISLCSSRGDRVIYSHGIDDDDLEFQVDGWWCENLASWANNVQKSSPDSIISLERLPHWHDLGLSWPSVDQSSSVVDFRDGKK